MVRSSRRLVDAAAVLLVAGCGDSLSIDVHYRVVGLTAVSAGQCGPAPTAPPEAPGATRVRFTFRDHTATGPGPLRCDAVLARGAAEPVLSVPRRAEPVDLWVEYVTDDGTVVARGQRAGVDLTGGDTVTIYAGPTNGYACAPTQTTLARAFHSATLLPTGEVLLFGGLVGTPSGAGDFTPASGAYVTGSAEIYDPVNQRVFPLTLGIAARAFHQVVVLGTDGSGNILLAVSAGLGVNGDASAAGNVAAIGGPAGEAPWRAVAADGAMNRAGTATVAAEILSYAPTTRTVTRMAIPGFVGALFSSGGADDPSFGAPPVIGGGAGATGDQLIAIGRTGVPGVTMAGSARVGASIVAQSATSALWIGGGLDGTHLYDRISGLDTAGPTASPGPAPPGADFVRAFGAAVRVGTDVFAFGGLRIAAGAVIDDTSGSPAVRIDSADAITAYANPALISTAYGAAAQAPGPSALVTGGVVTDVACVGTLACVSNQSVRVDPALVTPTGAPGVARYGHRLTVLPDGTILVTGGFAAGAAAGELRAVATLERFEPHQTVDDPIADLGLTRAPGDVARDQGAPVAPCTIVRGAAIDGAPAIDAGDIDGPDVDAM